MNTGNFPDKLNIVVTTASGIERALKKELFRLGYGELPAENGAISLIGSCYDLARLNVNLRTADRVYISVAKFKALSFDELFDGVKSIPWENYIDKNGAVLVDGRCVKSTLFAVTASQKIVKKAIVERLKKAYRYTTLPESGEKYQIQFRIEKDIAEILINTSGVGLNKRGYRDLVGIAPIKETLASAMLLYSDFYYKNPFYDPFCGSGTFAIEATKIALDIAPNLQRSFDFNYWKNFPSVFDLVKEEALDNEKRDRKIEIFASDIDKKAVKLATHHAEKAGVSKYINFSVKDVKDFSTDLKNGTICTNPPYGERVFDYNDAISCYKALGEIYKKYPTVSQFVITPVKAFEKAFSKKADRKTKLFNSDLECYLYYYYGVKEKNND